jgi:hypothetical protein
MSDFNRSVEVIQLQLLLALTQRNPNDDKDDDGSKATTSQFLGSISGN